MSEQSASRPYPEVPQQPSYPEIERRVLEYWKENECFEASVEQRPAGPRGSNEYVFYDGPPFANGLPHYGHLLTGYVKDVVPRYQTMKGRRVERRFGWDCHGLPAELEAEKQLQISGRMQILDFGVAKFNEACRSSVMKYTSEWRKQVTRMARWVDFDHDYKTMQLSYMESVMWAFKQLYDKGLVYEGYRVMPYSWAAETPLSNFETRLDNSYRERQDPALTVRFSLREDALEGLPGSGPVDLLAWTTTPWTLPSNLMLAVGPDIDYVVLAMDGRRVILGAGTKAKYEKEFADATELGTVKGESLVGRHYQPLLPFFADNPNSFQVIAADFVDTEEGSGIVHMAPGFGEDDMNACEPYKVPVVCPVDGAGKFTSQVPDYEGMLVFEANKPITRRLREEGKLVKQESYLHNYPHCWRTDEPLIYKALSSWYVKVSAFRERMVELNQEINWIPEHIRDGLFGKWLEGARDWSISRNRFWGAPIPIWKSDNPEYPRIDVYGSIAELERDFGVEVKDLHRPFIDELTRPNPDDPSGKSTMRRVEDVLDCWFESGSMPYAQVHYPFENKDWFEDHFPSDFIVEYVAQTRGWFYTMMVLSTALFDRPPFKNCICHGVVLDENGQKLSKRLRNYPDPEEIFESHGSDALRWFFMQSPILKGNDLQIDKEGKAIGEIVRLVLNPIWNAYYFFSLYANSDGIRAQQRTDSDKVLDRYILAKTHELITDVEQSFEDYDLAAACGQIQSYLDALNNWYIRRSRERFWREEQDQDKQDAYDTLYSVLLKLLRVAAPLLPLLSEEVYRGLSGERSVHLSDWPNANRMPADPALVHDMDRVRQACSVALSLRRSHEIRVRQPLSKLTLAGPGVDRLAKHFDLIREEVNVKEVELSEDIESFASWRLKVDARKLGPRLGKEMKKVIAASKKGEWKRHGEHGVEVAGQLLEAGEFELLLDPKGDISCAAVPANDTIVVLDTEITEELRQQGLARDLIRAVQQARKDSGLHVSDRIELAMQLPNEDWKAVAKTYASMIQEATLAESLSLVDAAPAADWKENQAELAGEAARICLRKTGPASQ
ncbi:MAG: isoleucine--tRNA ligase [Planctomycetota bacterium]|nr:MAG: isoleucine--tRNA ligase [Planctomycetota bacterium]